MNLSIGEFEIVEANKEDHQNLLGFLVTSYPDLGWSEQFMQWQYYDNPSGVAKSWVAKHNGNVIANYTAIPHQLKLNNKLEKSWRVQDVITHPDYRGLGLYSLLSDSANEFLQSKEFPLNFTFPNENSHSVFIKRNWINPNRIPLWILVEPENAITPSLNIEVQPLSEFTHNDESIWKNYCDSRTIAVERSANFLNWRYIQNPRGGYSPFRLTDGDKSAICVIKSYENPKGEKYAHLMDYFFEDEFRFEEIINFFLLFSKEKNIKLSSTWSQPNSEISRCLSENNFKLDVQLTRWHVLNINSHELNRSDVIDFSNWHISMGDSDVF